MLYIWAIRWTLFVSNVEGSTFTLHTAPLKVMLLMYIYAVTGMELIKVDPELPVDHPPRDCKSKTVSKKAFLTSLRRFTCWTGQRSLLSPYWVGQQFTDVYHIQIGKVSETERNFAEFLCILCCFSFSFLVSCIATNLICPVNCV